ncbi:matrix metalloproteinase-14-like [Patiria miniata]|uniref:Peptidase metallopeptidase domain-containing protein n=1 Tax=Patiria miniata TaxID=46514 RepID=A0A914AS84_PATMI|nr:matrix metalloproteinase-14-like [Patiria miniata]
MATGGLSSLPALLKTVLAIFCLACRPTEAAPTFLDLLEDPSDISTLVKAAGFLANYGYISPEKGQTSPEQMNVTEMSFAIRKMQRYAAVNQTGVLDQPTVRMINTARCGVHDEPEELSDSRIEYYVSDTVVAADSSLGRKKRYAVAGLNYKWNKNDIKYKLTNYPDESRSRITKAQVRADTERALKVWSDVIPLTFSKVNVREAADMEILFGSYHHTELAHDPTFDGPGGTLAHAFFPNSGWGEANGDVHLDDSETFTHREFAADGTDYLYTVAHEIGHALSMSHATDRSSLMFPYDKGYIPDFVLPEDDTRGIQLLYGKKTDAPSNDGETTAPVAHSEHEVCRRGVDSLTMVDNVLHVFSGNKFWRFSETKDILGQVEGTVSRDYFERLNAGTTAVYTRWDVKLVFLRGRNYWAYDGSSKDQAKARKIANLGGVPKSPTAVMHDRDQRHTYFFKYSKVWKYDEQSQSLVDGFPMGVHKAFDGLPKKGRVQAAFTDEQGDRYLLVGRQYYRFPNGQNQLDPEFPKDFLVDYFGCQPVFTQ